jgi:phytoene synthase
MPQFSADIAACRALLCGGSRSFFAASLLLPKRVRDPATALYAFCRVADDAIDLGDNPVAALAAIHGRLDAAYAGIPHASPIDRAFAATVRKFDIPKAVPAALIEGLAWDCEGRRYGNFEALLDYAARVAGSVGVMMALVMGVREPAALARASDLGVAMQLTNIARDVGEDARAGRLFLPLDWLAAAGIDVPAFLARPEFTPALGVLVQRLLKEATTLYDRSRDGIAMLPLDCRIGIGAAARIYAGIGDKLRGAACDSINQRARVAGRGKVRLAFAALPGAVLPRRTVDSPALAANLFLIAAVVPRAAEPSASSLIKLLDLFERLERDQRRAAASAREYAT